MTTEPTENEQHRRARYRINISTSVKGVITFDCTVDAEGFDMEAVLDMSDTLVARLKARYPLGGGTV